MAKHNETGKWGEDLACDELVRQGCTIRERNWRLGHDEIDIVAAKDDTLIVVEVKTRTDPDFDPLEAVDDKKIRAMVRAAGVYLRSCSLDFYVRFDLFAINGTPDDYTIEHIPDAFYPPLQNS